MNILDGEYSYNKLNSKWYSSLQIYQKKEAVNSKVNFERW